MGVKLASYIEGRTQGECIRKQGTERDIWV